MDKLFHLWIVVFVVAFVIFTVKSSDGTHPDNVLKTEVRSATWRQVLLKNGGDDSDEITKRDYWRRDPQDVAYHVCLATLRGDGTTDNIRIRAYENEGPGAEWRYDIVGQGPAALKICCYWVSNFALNEIVRVKVGSSGTDTWTARVITIYDTSTQHCYKCLCNRSANECKVSRNQARHFTCEQDDNCYRTPDDECHE